MKLSLRLSVLIFACSLFPAPVYAQERVVKPNYEQASKFDSAYLRQRTYSSSVSPKWIAETDRFWYSYKTSTGTRYYLVDPEAGTRTHLFDHVKVAAALSLAVKQPLESTQLSLGRAKINDEGTEFSVTVEKKGFTIELATGKVTARETDSSEDEEENSSESRRRSYRGRSNRSQDEDEKKPVDPRAHRNFSPDRTAYVFVKEHNLYYVEASEEMQAEIKVIDARMKKEKREKAKAEAAKAKGGEKTTGEDEKSDESGKDGEEKDVKKSGDKTSETTGKDDKDEGKDGQDDEDKGDDGKEDGDKGGDGKDVNEGKDKEQGDKTSDEDGDDDGKKSDESDEDGDEKKEPEKKVDEREAWADDVDESQALQLTDDGEEDYGFSGGRNRGPRDQLEVGQEALLDVLQTGEFEDFLPGDDDDKDDDKGKDGDKKETSKDSDEEDDEEEKPEEPKKSRPSVNWSQDSTAFYSMRRDSRNVEELFLVNSLSTPRPTLESYSYPLPGEENISRSELHVFDRARKTLFRVASVWKDEGYRNVHWGKTVTRDEDEDEDDGKKEGEEAVEEEEEELDLTGTGDTLRFLRRDRLVRNVEFCSVDTRTAECTTLIEEGFQRANISTQSVRYLKERDELIWWSERSGWGHFYLYSRDGKLKNAITSGPFRASRIVEVDEDKGLLYFRGNAREEGENIYYDHLYRVFLDGSGLILLDPGDATHRSNLSPTRKFLVDNCSRVDMAPISRLCDAEGKEVMQLEESDLSRLYAAGWTMPETFSFKAADGVTDLYGNLWKPFDFDATKKYAVIAEVYPGPQMEGVSHSFSSSHGRQQLAQLGFLVVQLGHRGGTPGRSKAYHSYGYFNLRDYGLADKKAGIEQLAEQRPYVDINRIGIYGHSGGGFMTAAALMLEPYNDFFKVGVSSSGNHDNNVYGYYWAERYHGLREVEVEEKERDNSRSRSRQEGESEARDDGDDEKDKQDDKKGDGEKVKKDGKDDKKGDGEEDGKDDKKGDGEKDGKDDEEQKTQTRFQIQVPSNAELAANLKGHLLLVHGDMDNNVHPAGTLRLVDALIRENKRFDMLIFPGKRHGYGDASSYFTQRKWDYFVEHLMGHSPRSADINNKD